MWRSVKLAIQVNKIMLKNVSNRCSGIIGLDVVRHIASNIEVSVVSFGFRNFKLIDLRNADLNEMRV